MRALLFLLATSAVTAEYSTAHDLARTTLTVRTHQHSAVEDRKITSAEPPSAAFPATNSYLANNSVLIIRHAEKPDEEAKDAGLTEAGVRRAQAYANYFQPLREGGLNMRISALYAGADSTSSHRPRLTLEPLGQASGMPLDTTVSTKNPDLLVNLLKTRPHGLTPLVCWRHGQIPALLSAFGANPAELLPNGKWPDDVYDWLILLQFDSQGELASQKLIHESLKIN